MNLAVVLAESGQIKQGIEQFESILQDKINIFEPKHDEIEKARQDLDQFLKEYGPKANSKKNQC